MAADVLERHLDFLRPLNPLILGSSAVSSVAASKTSRILPPCAKCDVPIFGGGNSLFRSDALCSPVRLGTKSIAMFLVFHDIADGVAAVLLSSALYLWCFYFLPGFRVGLGKITFLLAISGFFVGGDASGRSRVQSPSCCGTRLYQAGPASWSSSTISSAASLLLRCLLSALPSW